MTTDLKSRRALLELARQAIAVAVGAANDTIAGASQLPIFDRRCGAFVTLMRARRLRGCVGRIEPDGPLRTLIPSVARSAALEDPRFGAVQSHELSELHIEISLLSVPERLSDWEKLDIGVHGLIVRAGWQRGLLLPQVATQLGWDRERFLDEVCLKAGLAPDAWREPATVVQSFTAEVFAEGIEDESG
jgi:AmmeMemoRadiSam system protein A